MQGRCILKYFYLYWVDILPGIYRTCDLNNAMKMIGHYLKFMHPYILKMTGNFFQ